MLFWIRAALLLTAVCLSANEGAAGVCKDRQTAFNRLIAQDAAILARMRAAGAANNCPVLVKAGNQRIALLERAASMRSSVVNCEDATHKNSDRDAGGFDSRQITLTRNAMSACAGSAGRELASRSQTTAPNAPLPPSPARRRGDCSDVSGTSGPRIRCDEKPAVPVESKPSSKPVDAKSVIGLSCPKDDCESAKWTREQPYNHSLGIIAFQQFVGVPINIPNGYSLWSVPDDNAPNRRRLEARSWSGNPRTGTGCREEYTKASVNAFEVAIDCETERQAKLQEECEGREDYEPYKDFSWCAAPKTVQLMPDWEKRSPEFWKLNPKEPVAWCFVPARDGRTDSFPLREPKWHTAKQCSESLDGLAVSVSARGAKGCKFKGE
jgi:hypothetical protein